MESQEIETPEEDEIESPPATFIFNITYTDTVGLTVDMLRNGYWYMWAAYRPFVIVIFKDDDDDDNDGDPAFVGLIPATG